MHAPGVKIARYTDGEDTLGVNNMKRLILFSLPSTVSPCVLLCLSVSPCVLLCHSPMLLQSPFVSVTLSLCHSIASVSVTRDEQLL